MMSQVLGFFPFPIVVVSLLLIFKFFLYRGAGGVNDNFTRKDRSIALENITRSSIAFSLAVFVLIQFIRLRIFSGVISDGTSTKHGVPFYIEIFMFVALLFAELLVLAQLLGNIFYSWLSVSRYRALPFQPLLSAPKVAALVPTCDEDPRILERSIRSLSLLDYPNLQTLVIENSRDRSSKLAAHQLAGRYGVTVLDVENRGTKASALNAGEASLQSDVQYLAIFDADQRIEKQMLTDLLPLFEGRPRLGWIQTAQLYDSDSSLLNCAISQTAMQSYDNLMEGFSALKCAFCYGTNFIIRRKALQEVGGWDVSAGTSLTEDISTSLLLHQSGWQSLYVRQAYAHGVAPPTLEAFWRQQRRWATGTSYLLLKFVRQLFEGKLRGIRISVLTAYAIALTYYPSILALSLLIAWPSIILVSYCFSPRLFVATTTIPSSSKAVAHLLWLFASLYPFYIIASFFPYVNMKLRGYRLRNMLLVQSLLILSAPAYIRGVTDALLNRLPNSFVVTAKTARRSLDWRTLVRLPQFYALGIFLITGTVMTRLLFRNPSNYIMWIILFWIFVNCICLSHLFLFYGDETTAQSNDY